MSQINVNTITGKDGGSAVNFPNGITVTGVVTATQLNQNVTGNVTAGSFTGPLTGNVTGNCSGTAGSLAAGATGADLTLSGNLTVQGTTTTIDTAVTDVDSLDVDGNVNVGAGLSAYGYKIEQGRTDSTSNVGGTHTFDLGSGHIQRWSAATGSNYAPNFRIDASTTLNSKMNVGDVTAATLIIASSSHYCLNTIQVDGTQVGVTTSWIGGAAPTAANGSGYDIYAFTIMKTSATPTYHIIANATSAA